MLPINEEKLLFEGSTVSDATLSDSIQNYDYLIILYSRGSSLEVSTARNYYKTSIVDTSEEYHVLSYDIRSSSNWYQVTTKKIHLKDNKIEKVSESGLSFNGSCANISDDVSAINICKVVGYKKKGA